MCPVLKRFCNNCNISGQNKVTVLMVCSTATCSSKSSSSKDLRIVPVLVLRFFTTTISFLQSARRRTGALRFPRAKRYLLSHQLVCYRYIVNSIQLFVIMSCIYIDTAACHVKGEVTFHRFSALDTCEHRFINCSPSTCRKYAENLLVFSQFFV